MFFKLLKHSCSSRHIYSSFGSKIRPYSSQQTELSVDSSINTMEQILAILHNAHATKNVSRDDKLKLLESDPEKITNDLLASLGNAVFDLRVLDVLMQLQLKNDIDIFNYSRPVNTHHVLERYVMAFKSQYSKQSSSLRMSEIAKMFSESPQRISDILSSRIRKTAKQAMRQSPSSDDSSHISLDFCRLNLYNPFREDTEDPFALRKGLSTNKFPSNLFTVMINDRTVIEAFISDMKKKIAPSTIQNIMVAQTMYGKKAFQVLIKRLMTKVDPHVVVGTPFEDYLFGLEHDETMKNLKAIVAHRSMLLKRLDWFPPYRRSLQQLHDNIYNDDIEVISMMEGLFDRFFGVCYKMDAAFCEQWASKLIDFYSQNKSNPTLFDKLLTESIFDFKKMVTQSNLNSFGARWMQNEYLSKTGPQLDRKPHKHTRPSKADKTKSNAALEEIKSLVHSAKASISHSIQSHAAHDSPKNPNPQ